MVAVCAKEAFRCETRGSPQANFNAIQPPSKANLYLYPSHMVSERPAGKSKRHSRPAAVSCAGISLEISLAWHGWAPGEMRLHSRDQVPEAEHLDSLTAAHSPAVMYSSACHLLETFDSHRDLVPGVLAHSCAPLGRASGLEM